MRSGPPSGPTLFLLLIMVLIGKRSISGLFVLIMVVCLPAFAQRKGAKPNHHQPDYRRVTVRVSEPLTAAAQRWEVSPEELASANGLPLTARLRKGQRIVIPVATLSETAVAQPNTGEVIGKRIVFAEGDAIDVDDAWKEGDTVWYRRHGTSQSLQRAVSRIEDRYKPLAVNESPTTPKKEVTPKATNNVPASWIYLVDGARLRVDEVREVADGAWYNRGNVAIFLARERISRIEREMPGSGNAGASKHGWSSGNANIDDLIRRNASRFAIDPYLVFLVIEQESHFRTHALSPKGARGLMQLMPGTARRFGVARPFDPAENIRGGTQYLKQLLTMFRGRVDLALASYNAGEGRVLDYGNRVPPFRETRDYVRRISSRYRNHVVKED
jgi:soluble lytic murein transglycosylase-like protein